MFLANCIRALFFNNVKFATTSGFVSFLFSVTVCTKSTPKLTQQLSNAGLPRQFCLASLRQEHNALVSGTKKQFFLEFNCVADTQSCGVSRSSKMLYLRMLVLLYWLYSRRVWMPLNDHHIKL